MVLTVTPVAYPTCFTYLLVTIPGNPTSHSTHGSLASKYLERMSKSNDQIIKLAELVAKEQEKQDVVSPDDIFKSIGD